MGALIAVTEAERVGIISATAIVLAASIPACMAAWTSMKTRKENSEQHNESQRLLANLMNEVYTYGSKLDDLKDDVAEVGRRVDDAHHRIDSHIDETQRSYHE